MNRSMSRRHVMRTIALLMWLGSTACGLLDVSDPTAIEDQELDDAAGAALLRGAALRAFADAATQTAAMGGLLADEFFTDPPNQSSGVVGIEEVIDRRASSQLELQFGGAGVLGREQEARRAASVALPKLVAFGPHAQAGEVYALRGFATVRLAETLCPGFPLHELSGYGVAYSGPLTTDQVFERALADFDSAVAEAGDSARVLNLARVGRARTLLGLGRFAEAGTAAAEVPTIYVWNAEYGGDVAWNALGPSAGGTSRGIADVEGGNGLDFLSAQDPRLAVFAARARYDGLDSIFVPAKYPDEAANLVIASGIEARLIQAEADLAGGGTAWIRILNDLRAEQSPSPLVALTDPGTAGARVDLLFRERAFWLFATGHRLGDLRRLMARYDRDSEDIFPVGEYWLGDDYENATSIPFVATAEAQYSPEVTGCTSR